MKAKLNDCPLTLCGREMNYVYQEKYLGDQICSAGLAASALATVEKRADKVNTAIYEIKAIIEDCRINCVGGLSSGLHLWEAAVIPFITNNSETWTELSKCTVDRLEGLQIQFLRALFATPSSTPTPALCWETGTLTMANRIAKKKLLFFHHLLNLEPDTLAYEVAAIQSEMGYPGLIKECNELTAELRLEDIRSKKMSKLQWKKAVNSAILEKNCTDLLGIIAKNYKKLDYRKLSEEKFEMKEYIKTNKIQDSRTLFQAKSKMMRSVKMNYKNHPEYLKTNWSCSGCSLVDSQEHLLWCDSYAHLREGLDLAKDDDLVRYYRNFLRIRADD